MKKSILLLFLILIAIHLVAAGNITRSFSSEGVEINEEFEVHLTINIGTGDSVYAIEESIPTEANVTNLGGGSLSDKLRWIEFSNITNKTIIYKVKISSTGDYNFTGEYSFNGGDEKIISGSSVVSISGSDDRGDDNTGSPGGSSTTRRTVTTPTQTTTTSTSTTSQTQTDNSSIGGQTESGEKSKKSSLWLWIILLIIVIIIALVVVFAVMSIKKSQNTPNQQYQTRSV